MFSDKVSDLEGSSIRATFKLLADPEIISFAGGAPAPTLFPAQELAQISEEIIKNNSAVALQYGVTEGYVPLREYVTDRMTKFGNVHTDDQLIITSGGQQVLDLAFKVFLNEGDVAVVESPSFIGGLNALRSQNARLIPVKVQQDGLDTKELENIVKKEKIKILYTIPTFQNPSGITMSMEKRREILRLASKYDFYVLEDNPYGELRFRGEDIPTIKSMDTEGRVIYAGSFSKVLSAGMRIGFAIARKDIMEKMVICKQVADVHTPVLTQMMAYEFCTRYSLDDHIEKSRRLYGERCSAMLGFMDKDFPDFCTYTRPEGGIFLWCSLPAEYDTSVLFKRAVEKKVAFVAGSGCEADSKKKSSDFRLNYSLSDIPKIEEGIKRLAEVILNY